MEDNNKFHGRFVEVPPPEKATVQDIAETLGLCTGLRAERPCRQYRCANCSKMQPGDGWYVWVPDGVRDYDPAWSVTEKARQGAYNGHASAWCLSCARKLSGKSTPVPTPVPKPVPVTTEIPIPTISASAQPFWKRLFGIDP